MFPIPRASGRARSLVVQAQAVKVSFSIPYRCSFGDCLVIVGAGNKLGQWDPQRGMTMEWSSGDVWVARLDVNEQEVEYKYTVKRKCGEVLWMPGPNIQLRLPGRAPTIAVDEVIVEDLWDRSGQTVKIRGLSPVPLPSAEVRIEGSLGVIELDAPPESTLRAPPPPPRPAATAPPTAQQQARPQVQNFAPPPPPPPAPSTSAPPPPPRSPSPAQAAPPRYPQGQAAPSPANGRAASPPAPSTSSPSGAIPDVTELRFAAQGPELLFMFEQHSAPMGSAGSTTPPTPADRGGAVKVVDIEALARRAYDALRDTIRSSYDTMDDCLDPSDPRALEADLRVATAAQKAIAWEKALRAATGRSVTLLPPADDSRRAREGRENL